MSIKHPIKIKTTERIVLIDHLFKLGLESNVEPTHIYEIFDMKNTYSDEVKYGDYIGQFIFSDDYNEWTFKVYEKMSIGEQKEIAEFIQLNEYTS